jgi:hypothetical protein
LGQVPDADVLVHLGDGAPEGLPLLQVAAGSLHVICLLLAQLHSQRKMA